MKRFFIYLSFIAFFLPLFLSGCASTTLKGMNSVGQKVYLGPTPINNTEAYETFIHAPHNEVSEQTYIFSRLKLARDLSFYHDGSWYNWLEAYRGGMWLMRNRYKKGQGTRDFLKNHVWRSEDTGKPHLVKYPDGSIHEAYYVLLNELDLLEETFMLDPKAKKATV